MTENKIKVLLADGFDIVRGGLVSCLKQDPEIEVVAEAADGYSCLKACRTEEIDVLLLDYDLQRPSGTQVLKKIRQAELDVRVIVMSASTDAKQAVTMLALGAIGVVPKQASSVEYVNAVRSVAYGYTYIPIDFMAEFVEARRNLTRTGNLFGFSPREMEILEATMTYDSSKEIADRLKISVRTVETHRNRMYRKTSCNSIDQLRSLAMRHGLGSVEREAS